MANAWCINAYDCNGCLIQTLQNLDSACIGVGVQYTAPNPLDDKRFDYIKYTDKCGCTCCLSWENKILIYATNGVIKNLTLTNDDVNEAIKIKWNDIFWSNRARTIVRYKTGSAPVSITDGTLAVEETTKNQYSSTPFSLSGVLDETTYYITAFAVDSNNTVISSQTASVTTNFWWKPSANTLAYFPFESDWLDVLWNYTLSNTWTQQTIGRKFTSNSNLNAVPTWLKTIVARVKLNSYSTWTNQSIILRWVTYNANILIQTNSSSSTNYRNPSFYMYYNSTEYIWWTKVLSTWTWTLVWIVWTWSALKWYINNTEYTVYTWTYPWTAPSSFLVTLWWSMTIDVDFSRVIFEKKSRTFDEFKDYYNKTKSKFWY